MKRKSLTVFLLIISFLFILAACSDKAGSSADGNVPPTEAPEASATPADGNGETESVAFAGFSRNGNGPGSEIIFGSYPKSQVTDQSIIAALNSASSPTGGTWLSYGFYSNGAVSTFAKYKDITYNSVKYRGVYFTSYREVNTANPVQTDASKAQTMQSTSAYALNTAYWFKFESLTWSLLNEQSGVATLVCKTVIDSREYSPNSTFYSDSTLRAFLTGLFYDTAFDSTQKALILKSTVDNTAIFTGIDANPYVCSNSTDAVFAPSYLDLHAYSAKGLARYFTGIPTTAYAKMHGIGTMTSDGTESASYWMRSPSNKRGYAMSVYNDASVLRERDIRETYCGVLPMLRLITDSAKYSSANVNDHTLTVNSLSADGYDYYGLPAVTKIVYSGNGSVPKGTFAGCHAVTEISLSSNDLSQINELAFGNCFSLTTLEMTSAFVGVGADSFAGCTNVTTATVPISVIAQKALPLSRLKTLTLNGTSDIPICMMQGNTVLESVNIKSSHKIEMNSFYGCTALKTVTLPPSLISIGNYAFYGCNKITNIIIPSTVYYLGIYAFAGCSSLSTVTFQNTSGWYYTESSGFINGNAIAVTTPGNNATYLKSSYASYYWYRS